MNNCSSECLQLTLFIPEIPLPVLFVIMVIVETKAKTELKF